MRLELNDEMIYLLSNIEEWDEFFTQKEFDYWQTQIEDNYNKGNIQMLQKIMGVLYAPVMNFVLDLHLARPSEILKKLNLEDKDDEYLYRVSLMLYKDDTEKYYGDSTVTELLNYITINDVELIHAYYTCQEDELDYSTKVVQTMMDEAYAQEAIEEIKSLKGSKSIDEYVRHLISDTYIKENGFELSTSEWSTDIQVDDARMQRYREKVKPLENYLDNCLEIALYLTEHTDCDAKLVVDYLSHAQQWYVDFEKIDNHANLLDEENPNQYAVKIDRVIKKICVFDSEYEELLNETYEEVGIVSFTKVFSYVIQVEGEESERIKHFYDLSGHLTCLEEEGKVVTCIHVGLKNEVAPYRYIDFDLKEMEDKNYGGEKFEESLIHYLNNIDTSWADDIVVGDGDMMMHHYTIEIDRLG